MSHCCEGNVSRSPLCELHVIEPSSVILRSPRVFVSACASQFPGGGPVGWQSCPVVVTVPGAASGTIWPLWKILHWSDIRAGMQEENQRDEADLRTARAVGTRHGTAMKWAKSQFAVRPGRRLEAHESSSLKVMNGQIYVQTMQNTAVLYQLLLWGK